MISSLLLLSCVSCVLSFASDSLDCTKLEKLGKHGNAFRRLQARGDRFVEFDWALSKELGNAEPGNIVISPISLKVVLAMLYEGANGTTAQEIRDALDLDSPTTALYSRMNSRERFSAILQSLQTSKGEYEIKMGTHVFIDKNAEPKQLFQCKLRHYYSSDMEKVDFSDTAAAVAAINNWASNVTEGHIQHLVSEAEAHSSTIMLLLNAVYFKGLWAEPFPENQTKISPFYLDETQKVDIPLMNTTDNFSYYNATDIDAQIIKLPYLGNKFAMYVVLPNRKSGLSALLKNLGPKKPLLPFIKNMTDTTVNLIMPKFEFDFTTSLRPTLEKLNIKSMFTSSADLSDIAETKSGAGLVVSNVLQKAGISVTERGTVAYAATVVELMDKFGGGEEVVEFHADHPFLFFIEDEKVETIVFVGKVTNPEKAKVVEDKIASDPEESQPTKPSNCSGASCYPATNQPEVYQPDNEADIRKFNYFDADLLKVLGTQEASNFVVSPASIKTLLGLVLEASEGTTQAEILRHLRLPQNLTHARQALSALQTSLQLTQSINVTIDSVAQAFMSDKLKTNSSYKKSLKDLYKADITPLDFTHPEVAANTINSWIRTRTRALITNLVDVEMITPETYAILTSAVYFDGKWKTEFLPGTTNNMCFYLDPNAQCQMTPMMTKSEELYYKYDRSFDSHVVQIPYQDDRFSMVIVLPHKYNGMQQLTIDASRLAFPDLLQGMSLYEAELTMPRFTLDYSNELIETLKKLGLMEVFSDKAQLPNMANVMGKVSGIIHKAKIEVEEKGTKAAAASGASVVPLTFGLDRINLTVNHPFYFFLYERISRTVLFAGRLSTPVGTTEGSGEGNNQLGAAGVEPLSSGGKLGAKPHRVYNQPYAPQKPVERPGNRPRDAIQFPVTENRPGSKW